MLFNSLPFLFVFLPITLFTVYFFARQERQSFALTILTIASLVFMAVGGQFDVAVLLVSVCCNFFFARVISTAPQRNWGLIYLAIGVAFNLFILASFKYLDLFAGSNELHESKNAWLHNVALPLGISFYTFQQIAYLADTFRGLVNNHSFRHYLLFVSFFPQLIAGPIVHHSEIMPQILRNPWRKLDLQNVVAGISYIVIGLFKKVVIADNIAPLVDRGFACAAEGQIPSFYVSWISSVGFGLQIYFDFSAYSDIAIGLALLFGIALPFNFASPYKATNIVDFWRRWHMTLSRFLRDYLYIPLGGNRRGGGRRTVNILITMLLGGLWHGAGINFVVWGAMHGMFIVAAQFWRRRLGIVETAESNFHIKLTASVYWFITHFAIVIAWVMFRATDFDTAMRIYTGMAGAAPKFTSFSDCNWYIYESFDFQIGLIAGFGLVYAGLLFAPNSQELIQRFKGLGRPWAFAGGLSASLMFLYCVYLIATESYEEFIYFIF